MHFVGCYICSLFSLFWWGRYDIQTFCIFFRFGSLIVGVASIHR